MIALVALLLAAAPPAGAAPAGPGAAAGDPQARLDAAGALYLSGDFAGAARGYQALVDEGFDGPSLHLDLGNSLLRAGARGRAVASFLRALRLDPSDADARANLALATRDDVDRLVGAAEPSFWARLVDRAGDRPAAGLFLGGWALLWLLLAARRLAGPRSRLALDLAIPAAALAAALGGALVAGRVADRRTPAAVVIAAETPLREGPSRTLRATVDLHEGTTVRLLEVRGELVRVRLANGAEGWVASADLEVV